jgi:hypothetical protein
MSIFKHIKDAWENYQKRRFKKRIGKDIFPDPLPPEYVSEKINERLKKHKQWEEDADLESTDATNE